MKWKNSHGSAAITNQAPRPIIIKINTSVDIFSLNEPLKLAAGVKPPALVFKPHAFWKEVQRCRMGGKLTTETEGLMRYVLDRRLALERILSSATLKPQTIWEIEDKISANLSEKGKEIMTSTEVSGLEYSSFRFEPMSEDLKERMAERSWTATEANPITLELCDRG